jgi:hypothetical protein
LVTNIAVFIGALNVNGKEVNMSGAMIVQVISGVLAAAVLGIIVYRRKQKSA